jgi:hypothetical protein
MNRKERRRAEKIGAQDLTKEAQDQGWVILVAMADAEPVLSIPI